MPRFLALLLLSLAACAATPDRSAASPRWHAVLVAGDDSLPVWDNATERMAALLGPDAVIRRFSDRGRGAEPADPGGVLRAIAGLRPGPGEGCLVFMTMHGAPGRGLIFAPAGLDLPPALLDRALAAGCGEAPTVAILSGCYTGLYAAAPVARPNRVILTAARPDRPSFGCGAGEVLTVYDECLLRAAGEVPLWRKIASVTGACVSRREQALRVQPSEPQAAFGDRVSDLSLR
jgi:hypothetical protein